MKTCTWSFCPNTQEGAVVRLEALASSPTSRYLRLCDEPERAWRLFNDGYLREGRVHFVLFSSIARDCYRPCMPQQWVLQPRNAGQAHPTALYNQAYRLTKQCACHILGWPPAVVRRLPEGRIPWSQPQLFNDASWRMYTRPAVFNLTVSAV